MSVVRRSPRRFLAVALAVPVILAVYLAVIVGRIWAPVRPIVAGVLGATVIGSVYAEEVVRRAPARVTPLRAAAVLALAVTLVGASVAPAPTVAAKPAEQMIAAAQNYLGIRYRLGATGPNRFDCSGLVFRVFADIGELPRISGKRLRAVGYLRWFSNRGLASKSGKRGDLVVYNAGKHIGIYLGDDKVLSALATGVTIHGLRAINQKVTAFLNVPWNKGDGTGGDENAEEAGGDADSNGKPNRGKNKNKNENVGQTGAGDGMAGTDGQAGEEEGDGGDGGRLPRGLATGTLNLRKAPGPDEKIIGWVSKGSQFKVLGTGHSPSGALWLNIKMANGKSGWIWAHWTRILER